ncbi:major facilitator superfamily domain-containing protein [Gongronella butleri]|nr:major facilitator superfamily domain-containing protein [Gongronella butleri]
MGGNLEEIALECDAEKGQLDASLAIADEGEGVGWQAWTVEAGVMMLNVALSMAWLSASSAPRSAAMWLQVSFPLLNWLVNVCSIVNTLLSLPTAWIYERFGIKTTLVAAALLNLLGCWIRYLAVLVHPTHRFALALVGQIIAATAGPLVTNLPRCGFRPGFEAFPTHCPFLVVAIVGTVTAALTLLLPSRPRVSPSISASKDRLDVWAGMRTVFFNVDFLWLLTLSSVGIGMALCFSGVIIEAILPYGYTEEQAGLCVAVIFLSGLVGAVATGWWMGKTSNYVLIIRIFAPLSTFSYIMLIFQILPNAYAVVLIACSANGFFSYGLFSVFLELASEVTYPVPESVSNCVISAACTVTAFLFTVILDVLRAGPEASPPFHMQHSCIAAAIIVGLGSIPCLFLKGDMKRLNVDTAR